MILSSVTERHSGRCGWGPSRILTWCRHAARYSRGDRSVLAVIQRRFRLGLRQPHRRRLRLRHHVIVVKVLAKVGVRGELGIAGREICVG